MLPRPPGHSALPVSPRSRGGRRVLVVGVALTALAGVAVLAPSTARARNGIDVWTPSNWTGEVAGPPVPGTGLPPAALPVIQQALPQGFDVSPTYEGQAQCDPAPKPGTQKLTDLIKATYGGDQTVWISRACDVGGQSEHKEGRALDWMTSVRDAQQRANAETFLAWLLGPDQFGVPYGNAMRLGVMYIGWNDRIWRGYDIKRGWTELKGCFATPSTGMDATCHRNHIHISLTWDGASARTSFWDGTPMDAPYCAAQHTSATTVAGGRSADIAAIAAMRVLSTRNATGIPVRCRLQQDRWNGDSHRLYAKVTGLGGVPETGVAAVAVQVTALASNSNANVRIWSPGQSKSQVVVKVPMNMDAVGTAIVPVSNQGTIALAASSGATDIAVDVVGWYGPGDVPNDTVATPGAASPMSGEGGVPPPPTTVPAPPAPTPPAPPDLVDEFISIGSEVGYESAAQGPLQPGEERTVSLAAVPASATSVLVLVTTRAANKKGNVRIGMTPDVKSSPKFAFPKKGVRTAVMIVPVSNAQIRLAMSKKASVQVRVEVLGYAINGKPIKARSLKAQRISKSKMEAGATLTVGPLTGLAGLPKKAKKITGVILQIWAKTKGPDAGAVKAYPLDGAAPGTRSAPIVPGKPYTSLVVAELGTDGKIVTSPSVQAKVKVTLVGYIHR